MPLPYLPKQGEILICDFDDVARGAEMIKRRPIVIVSRKDAHRNAVFTVVPLSTTAPDPVRAWHHALPHVTITGWHAQAQMWAKGDMITTVSRERLNKPYRKARTGGRQWVTHYLDEADLQAILAGVRSYLGL
ncbi:MAG: type II toxin-antitoxin system PemK/MazF family toxin [Leptothrix sp. (in: b-proteobacteria)]